MTPKAPVFLRDATGLVRAWSPFDGFIYNFNAINPIPTFAILFVTLPFVFNGADVLLSTLFGIVVFFFVGLTYASMTVIMPRSGGDYVFESRTLHPAIGFMNGWAFLFIVDAMWGGFDGIVLSQGALAPLLTVAGVNMHSPAMLAAGNWFAGDTGTIVVLIIAELFCGLINFGGMKIYARTQKVVFLIMMVAIAMTLGIFATSTSTQFIQAFNRFAMAYTSDPDAYHSMINVSAQAGFVMQKTSISQSLMAVSIYGLAFTGQIWAVQQAGEIKRAGSFASQVFQMIGSLVFAGVIIALVGVVMYPMVGSTFLGATGYLYLTGNSAYPLTMPPYFSLFAMITYPNGIVAAIISLGLVLSLVYSMANGPLGGARFLFAAAFDRALPAKFSEVDDRFHVPSFSIIVFMVVACILGILYSLRPDLTTFTLDFAVAMVFMELCTCIGGAVLPYRMKGLYKSSIVAKYEIAGIPLMSITGIASAVLLTWLMYLYATIDALGVNAPLSAIFLVVCYASGIILYYVARAYRKREGIDLNMIYKEVPPE